MKKNSESNDPQCVKVALRCRPLSQNERKEGHQEIVKIVPQRGQVIVKSSKGNEPPKVYTFDMVFEPTCQQESIFKQSALPIIESVLEGYNGTIFAYGQTGTGKTHTMEGLKNNPRQLGIIPRSFAHLFKSIEGTPGIQFNVWVSMLELYNQQILDLFEPNKKDKLNIHENPSKEVYVEGLSEKSVSSLEEMKSWLAKGSQNRHTASTQMNKTSSRSHSIFIIKVEMTEVEGEKVRRARFNLVDLAGSERIKKTKAEHNIQQQGIAINLALSTLGQVIGALSNPSSKHIPYRDSKLTRLLQDSLGGNTKTVMIANIGPSDFNCDETLSTLRYANQAKNIKNKPRINENQKDAKIRECQLQIQQLKELLERGGKMQQKIVVKYETVTKEGKMNDVKRKIKQAEAKLAEENEEEKKRVQQSLQSFNSEREKLMEQLREKERNMEEQRQKQQKLKQQYRKIKDNFKSETLDKERIRAQEKELILAQQKIDEKKQAENRLREKMEKFEEEGEIFGHEASIKEKAEKTSKKLTDILNKLKRAKEQTNEIHEFRNTILYELEQQNRQLTKQLKFINLLIESFIPFSQLVELRDRSKFNEDLDDWIVDDYEGPPLSNPGSAFGFKRPLCEFTRMAVTCGDDNPRYRPDNILVMDLDLPQRTTEDFDSDGISEKLSQTINIVLAEDEQEQKLLANEKQPNVYIEDPHKMNKEALLKQREENLRAKSAKKILRPGSGRKKKV